MAAIRDVGCPTYFLGSMLSGGGSDPKDISAKGWLRAVDVQGRGAQDASQDSTDHGIDACTDTTM
jgi:hypothetical protein